MRSRCAVGRRIPGAEVTQHGGVVGRNYRLAVKVVAMGGGCAVDIAQLTHEEILRPGGCLVDSEILQCGRPPPSGSTVEGLYADDHIVLGRVDRTFGE